MGELAMLSRPQRFYLGVDVGRRHHVVTIISRATFDAGNKSWQSAPTLKVTVNREGFERLRELIAKHTDDPSTVVAGVEPTGGYYSRTIHAFLQRLGADVLWLKNQAVHDTRDAVYGKRTKTDPVDARLIARLLWLRDTVGQEYAFATGHDQIGAYSTLRLLVSNRWRLKQAQRRTSNQLTQILDVIFPEFAEIFSRPASGIGPVRLLARYPTPADLLEASLEELHHVVIFEAKIHSKARLAERLHEKARVSVGIDQGISDLLVAQEHLVGQLLHFHEELRDVEARIVETLPLVPEAEIVCSFPAAGQIRAATVLGAMGAPVSAFHSDKALRRHLGWSVDVERSGTSVARERLTRSGNRHARLELRIWAWCLVSPKLRWSPFRGYYERLISPPISKRRSVALGHLSSKLITGALPLHDHPPALRPSPPRHRHAPTAPSHQLTTATPPDRSPPLPVATTDDISLRDTLRATPGPGSLADRTGLLVPGVL